jgi:hypothetical protein
MFMLSFFSGDSFTQFVSAVLQLFYLESMMIQACPYCLLCIEYMSDGRV